MKPRSMLITGATGGLGLALVEAARRDGHDVLATGRSTAARGRIEASGARFVAADLTDAGAAARLCAGRESIVHAAALSAAWGREEDFRRINVEATGDLIEAAAAAGCGRFTFVSSPSIFASFRDRLGIRGSDPPADPPLNYYARSKLAAERLVLEANGPAMATCAVRPRAISGPDDRVLLPALAALVRRRRMPLIGGGGALIELTDVRDAARGILLAEARIEAIAGRAVNISGGRPVPVREIADGLAEALGASPRRVNLPVAVARAAAVLLEAWARLTASEPALSRYALATLAYSQTFDMAEPERLIGYRPEHDGLATLLAEAGRMRVLGLDPWG
jgi:nucleoside-diphosphate-sugar epimerase